MDKLVAGGIGLVLSIIMITGTDIPVKYVSHSTNECVYMESQGEKLPCDSSITRYSIVWVE